MMNLQTIRKHNKERLKNFAVVKAYHEDRMNPDILDQSWEYSLNKTIEFLLEEIYRLKKKDAR